MALRKSRKTKGTGKVPARKRGRAPGGRGAGPRRSRRAAAGDEALKEALQASLSTGQVVPWSGQRWLGMILLALAVQVLLLALVGQWTRPEKVPVRPAPAVALGAGEEHSRLLEATPTLADAALLPLPSMEGFSAEGWLKFEPQRHELKEWREKPRWLGLSQEQLGQELDRYLENQYRPPMRISDKPSSPLTGGGLLASNIPMLEESRLEITGALAGRPLLQTAELPSWPHVNLLTNTVLRLMVDETGWTFSVALLTSSGLPEADHWALYLANALRFEPRLSPPGEGMATDHGRFMQGQLVFRWHTLKMAEDKSLEGPSS